MFSDRSRKIVRAYEERQKEAPGGMAAESDGAALEGKDVITIEGLAKNGELDILQRAFHEEIAVQCGYCTPGMIMSSKALIMRNPDPSEEEIRTALSGNICRCSGYVQIIRAVKRAAKELREAA